MKLKITDLKRLLDGNKDNALVENLINYYFKGKFVPALISENTVIFYAPGVSQYYISEYAMSKTGIELNEIRKLTFEKEINESDKSQTAFKDYSKGIFEIDENRKSFSDSLKKIKKSIATNESVINEDVFLDRIKELGLSKAKEYLVKNNGEYGMLDNWKGNNENEFKKNLETSSKDLWTAIEKKVKENISGRAIDSFYDMYDVKKMKFNHEDGKGIYKRLEISFPKDKMWVNENEDFLSKASIEWPVDKNYGSVIDDTQRLLKGKKYCEMEEKCPQSDRVSDLLASMKGQDKMETFWKSASFKKDIKEMVESNTEIEDFVKKYEPIVWMSEDKLTVLLEKVLVDIYNDASMLTKAKEISEAIKHVIADQNIIGDLFESILGIEISSPKDLAADLANMSEEIRNYKSPEDDSIKFAEGLMNTIADVYSKYREKNNMTESDTKTISVILEKLNDIWARQRITEEDKKFMKSIAEQLESLDDGDKKASEKILSVKDYQRNGFGKFEEEILDKNTITVGTEKK